MMWRLLSVASMLLTALSFLGQASWQHVGSGVSAGGIRDMDYDPTSGRLYCVGRFQYAGDSLVNGTAYWDGSAWHPMGAGIEDAFGFPVMECELIGTDSVLVSGAFHTAVGVPDTWRTALWDGTNWRSIGPGGSRGAFLGMLLNEDGLTVAGGFDTIGGMPFNSIARYQSGVWEEMCVYPRREDIVTYSTIAKYQGRYVFGGNMNYSPLRELGWLDGDTLRRLGPGIQGDSWVNDLDVFQDELYVAGEFYASPTGNVANGIMAWNGNSFRDPLPGLVYTTQVVQLDVRNGELFISGNCHIPGAPDFYQLARFDGEQVCLYAKNVNAVFGAIASTGTELFAAPNMITLGLGGDTVNSIVRYDLTGPADTCFSIATGIRGSTDDLAYDLTLFPNPASSEVGLAFGPAWLNTGRVDVLLLDMFGRNVRSFSVSARSGQHVSLPVGDLPKGMYLAWIRTADGALVVSRSFLVQ